MIVGGQAFQAKLNPPRTTEMIGSAVRKPYQLVAFELAPITGGLRW